MFERDVEKRKECLYNRDTASDDAMKENEKMKEDNMFREQLALLGISAKDDKCFGLDALYNSEINEVTYNPRLLTCEKAIEILLYFGKVKG